MDGFTKMVKMKTGGSVSEAKEKLCSGGASKKYKTGGKVHDDEAQDKILIKKMILKEDKEEKPELKLKKGGRATKAVGTVKKFSIGGSDVEKEKSKPAGEKDPIVKVKPTGNKKAAAPSKAAVKPKEVKKFAEGGGTGSIPPELLAQIMLAQKLKNQPSMQNPVQSTMGNPFQSAGVQQAQQPQQPQQAPVPTPPEFNAFRNFQAQNPNSPGGMNPADIAKLLQSRQFQGASRNFTDR